MKKKSERNHRNFENFVRNHIDNTNEEDLNNLDVEFANDQDAKLKERKHDE